MEIESRFLKKDKVWTRVKNKFKHWQRSSPKKFSCHARRERGGEKGQFCKVEVVDGLQVKTCVDEFGEIISAGAERLTTTWAIFRRI